MFLYIICNQMLVTGYVLLDFGEIATQYYYYYITLYIFRAGARPTFQQISRSSFATAGRQLVSESDLSIKHSRAIPCNYGHG